MLDVVRWIIDMSRHLQNIEDISGMQNNVNKYVKKHRSHVSAGEYKHRAKGTMNQVAAIARKLRIPNVR